MQHDKKKNREEHSFSSFSFSLDRKKTFFVSLGNPIREVGVCNVLYYIRLIAHTDLLHFKKT